MAVMLESLRGIQPQKAKFKDADEERKSVILVANRVETSKNSPLEWTRVDQSGLKRFAVPFCFLKIRELTYHSFVPFWMLGDMDLTFVTRS